MPISFWRYYAAMERKGLMGLAGFVDTRRSVLAMRGSDARAGLQGIVTNDVGTLGRGVAVYAALLTPQGKYLFDFFLLEDGPEDVLIDVVSDRAEALSARLKMYCLRRDARVESAPRDVTLVWSTSADAHFTCSLDQGQIVAADPRCPTLGWRVYGERPTGLQAASTQDYGRLRVSHLVPETGIELLPDETYILEAGFERLDGVDFRKGCYVGQEVTARMKHKTELRKGLVQVAVSGNAEPGTPITAGGKPAGTLFTVADGQGLAHLRLDRAGRGMSAGEAVVDFERQSVSDPGGSGNAQREQMS